MSALSPTPVADRVVETIVESARDIRAGLVGRRTSADEDNPTGDAQLEADIWADKLLYERLSAIDGIGQFASEERDSIVTIDDGAYTVAIDPLDGSSNLKSNNSMGTVFSVYDEPLPASGRSIVTAGYVLYGPITTMVLATPDGVTVYELSGGDASVVRESVTIPDEPVVYGFGGRVPDWPDEFRSFATEIEQELKLRYGGAMIGDVNQVLTYGGIFAYPALNSRSSGKLRLQFEGAPIGYVIEQAGGRSSDGEQSLLECEPDQIHQRVPVHVGNESLIDRLEAALE